MVGRALEAALGECNVTRFKEGSEQYDVLVTLVGLIAKHEILIVEFANQLQESGKDKVSDDNRSDGIRNAIFGAGNRRGR